MKTSFYAVLASACIAGIGSAALGQARKLAPISRDPYIGAIVIDADSGQILGADSPDAPCYPASVIKLMNLLILLEKVQSGAVRLQDPVTVTAESARIGGSQVYLKEHEVFTVEELVYALMVQSANDAATALAIHLAGSKEAFVALMNARARELGMKATTFHSVHGLPPGAGQNPDVSTARDLARLARALVRHPDALRYTSAREHGFRNNTFILRTHNNLLGRFDGCDGLKTGYFRSAGYSIAATARRQDARVIAVVVGSPSRAIRDSKAAELLAQGFLRIPPKPRPEPAPTNPPPNLPEKDPAGTGRAWPAVALALAAALGAMAVASAMRRRRSHAG